MLLMKVPSLYPPSVAGETLKTNTLPFNKDFFGFMVKKIIKTKKVESSEDKPTFSKIISVKLLLHKLNVSNQFHFITSTILPASVTALQVRLKSFLLIVVSISKPALV